MKDEVELVRWRGGRSWEECSDQRVVTSKTLGWEGEGRLWDAELQVRKELSDGKGEWMLLCEWKLIMIFTLFSISMVFSLHQKKRRKKKGQNTLSKIQLLPDPHSSSGFTVLLKSMSKYFWKVWAFSFAWCVVLCLLIQLCPTLCGPMDCSLPGSSIHGDSPGKNTRVDCHDLLQGIFPTQGLNPGLPHCRQILYHLNHQGNPSPVQWHINRHKYLWGRQGGKFTEHTCSISRTWLLRHFPFPVNRGYGSVTWLGFRATIQPNNPIPGHISRENHNS